MDYRELSEIIKIRCDESPDLNFVPGKGPWHCIVGKSYAIAASHEREYALMLDLPGLNLTVCLSDILLIQVSLRFPSSSLLVAQTESQSYLKPIEFYCKSVGKKYYLPAFKTCRALLRCLTSSEKRLRSLYVNEYIFIYPIVYRVAPAKESRVHPTLSHALALHLMGLLMTSSPHLLSRSRADRFKSPEIP